VYNNNDKLDEVIALAKKVTPTKQEQASNHPMKHFQDPTQTWWGKIIVWILLFGMVGLIILSFVLAIIKGTA